MRNLLPFFVSLFVLLHISCTQSAQKVNDTLPAESFASLLKSTPDAQLVDVRTPGEFSSGHLSKAVNYDINGSAFAQQMGKLDKSKPVFVYCAVGGRSASAAAFMKQQGFQTVHNLSGGISAWKGAGKPVE